MKPVIPIRLAGRLAERVRRERHRYAKRLARCQKKFSEKAVHDLRVETRRMLALLEFLKATDSAKGSDKLTRTLTKRLRHFGHLRDTQVQLELLKPLWPKFPEADGFKTVLERREKKLIGQLNEKIKKTKGSQLNHQLKQIEKRLCKSVTHGMPAAAASAIEPALDAAFQEVLNLRRAVQPDNVASIHRMRVTFKRFHYMCELLQPLLPKMTDARLERMKHFQSQAGGIQDLQVLLIRIAHTIRDRKLSPVAARNLRAELLRRRGAAVNSFMMRIDDLAGFQSAFQSSTR